MNSKIRFTRIRDVKAPSYRVGDAGSDFYVPENTQDFLDALIKKNIEELDNNIWVEGDDIVVEDIEEMRKSVKRVSMNDDEEEETQVFILFFSNLQAPAVSEKKEEEIADLRNC